MLLNFLVPSHLLAASPETLSALQALANGNHRAEGHRDRNVFRHPAETLAFFGLEDDMVVVEISPGGQGWYTEILAPFLKERGKLYAASYDPESSVEYFRVNAKRFSDKLAADPENYGKVIVTILAPPEKLDIAPAGSADMVLTFRNVHNWMRGGYVEEVFDAFYKVLKPGGILGVVQHRGDPNTPQDPSGVRGYVNEDYVIALVERAGFKLVDSSEINANPRDTKDHPEGVWMLPPSLRLGDKDRAKYVAIGESDRMTLKFVKPQ